MLFTNIRKEDLYMITIYLQLSGLKNYEIISNKNEDTGFSILLEEDDYKTQAYEIELFHQIHLMMVKELVKQYRELGHPILDKNISKVYLGMNEEYVKSLCEEKELL